MKEIHSLEQYLYKHVNTPKELSVYSPDEFYKICQKAKAANVYNLILECMSSNRHSKERTEVNKHRVVSILYQMCYGLSQKCDFFQQDNGLFLKFSHLTHEGLETQCNLGTSCSSRVISRNKATYASTNPSVFNAAVADAITNQKLVILFIDDYTKGHTKNRPNDDVTSVGDNMCTIAIKVFDTPAIPVSDSISSLHNPTVVSIPLLTNYFCSPQTLQKFSISFASTLPELTTHFFDPLLERQHLEAHDYQPSGLLRDFRGFNDFFLLDFKYNSY